jgi:hypothetical protein
LQRALLGFCSRIPEDSSDTEEGILAALPVRFAAADGMPERFGKAKLPKK